MARVELTPTERYRSFQKLASGGMGEVELAVRSEGQFRRVYAVKRLLESMRDDAEARSMFLDEGRLAGLVRHPNVVSVLDVGDDERGPFLVMDFVEGVPAGALLSWATKGGITLPVQLCLRVVRDIAFGLHAAHELVDHDGAPLGLVHRDVSPQNILIGFDGIGRIADFGIAKAMGRTTRTSTGLLKGKAGYMSPEQLRFEEPDRRSDLFSLAVVLYELLAGERLYQGSDPVATARRILHEPAPDIDDVRDDVPPELVQLLFECLAKDPAARPETGRAVAARLDGAIAALVESEGTFDVSAYLLEHFADRRDKIRERLTQARDAAPVVLPPESESRTTSSAARRRAPWAGLALALGLAVSVAVGWALGALQTSEPAPASASVRPAAPAAAPIPAPPSAEAHADLAADEAEPEAPAAEPDQSAPAERTRRRPPVPPSRARSRDPEDDRDILFSWE